MNNQQRYWIRRVLLLVMLGLLGYALFQSMSEPDDANLEVGEEAPNFEFQTLEGKKAELSDYRGKVVLLNFWATWCKPCRTEMPDMQGTYNKFKNREVEILAVNIAEQPVTINGFVRSLGLTFPIGLDPQKEITKMYKVGPIPSSFFIDANGKITGIYQGQMNASQIEQGILDALK
ncbi:thiol-disulfide oxidoreductase ResA [Laceyella putida]|uniref:Thiol-disulfide oxidoreductase ResA n=1 Tax=Laceyella putida TaxID=110101 RepID=A0ABW2RL87_9BACL